MFRTNDEPLQADASDWYGIGRYGIITFAADTDHFSRVSINLEIYPVTKTFSIIGFTTSGPVRIR
jgi:hypothetical protein